MLPLVLLLCTSEENLAPSPLYPPINCWKTAVKSLFLRLSKWIHSASCMSSATACTWFGGLAAVCGCLSSSRRKAVFYSSLHVLSSVFTGGEWCVLLSCWLPSCSGSLGCSCHFCCQGTVLPDVQLTGALQSCSQMSAPSLNQRV